MDIQQFLERRISPCLSCVFPDFCHFFLTKITDGLINPVDLEPVIWAVRIAVKPVLRTSNRAPAGCLVDKGLRHQGHLIAEEAGQCDTLNQVLAALILATKDIKVVRYLAAADFHQIVSPMI